MALKKLIRLTTVPVSFRNLLRGQMRYMQQFYRVEGITSSGEHFKDVAEYEEVPLVSIPMKRTIAPFSDVWALIRLYAYFRKHRPHIVHTHTPKAGLLGMLAAWMANVPIRLHTVAGLPLLEETGMKKKVLLITEKFTYKFAHEVFPNSFGLREILVKLQLCETNKLRVLANGSSNGINLDYFHPDRVSAADIQAIKELAGIQKDDFVFLFVGRLVKDKGVRELMEAFAMLHKTHPQSRLLLVGKLEPERDELPQDVLHAIEHHSNIHYVGFQKYVRPYMMASHALVFPSYREGLPNVPLQAGALQLPCIVTDINGCNEIISHDINGYVIPPKHTVALYKAMKKMMENTSDYQRFVVSARHYIASRYDQKLVWASMKEMYDEKLKALPND